MPRHPFLGDLSAWATDIGADETSINSQSGKRVLFIPNATITFWTLQTGGVQITDLQDMLTNPITDVTADENGEFPQIWGPDTTPDTYRMWADGNGGAGPRRQIVAVDIGDNLYALASTVADLADQVNDLSAKNANSLGVVRYDTVTSSWPPRPADDARLFAWFGPTSPPVGGAYMVDGLDVWFATQPPTG